MNTTLLEMMKDFLCGQCSLNVVSAMRDSEAPVSNCIGTITLSMSTRTFQGGTFPEEVILSN